MATTKEVIQAVETKMKGVIEATRREFASVRTGRANPALLDRVTVDYYGTPTPIHQLASITTPESRLLVIQPYDKHVIKDMEKAILKADLGLVPNSDATVIRISIPPLTEERRRELVKVVRKQAEDMRIAIRNLRREANEAIKSLEKDGGCTEDERKRAQEDIQKLTDRYVGEVDRLLAQKEKEILEV